MARVLLKDVKKFNGKKVTCAGWVQNLRNVGSLVFIVLRDRSGLLQLTCKGEAVQQTEVLHLETCVKAQGVVKVDDSVKLGGVELLVEKLAIISPSLPKTPVDVSGKTETSFEHRFDHRAMDLRRQEPQGVFAVQSTLCNAFREILNKDGFTEVHTPKIISTGTEGGTSLFSVKYFEKDAFLAQSPQFYKQMLVGSGFERVFEIAPVFRAEEHNTPWHLNEYVSLDFEMGFVKSELDVIRQTERVLKHMVRRVSEKNNEQLKHFKVDLKIPKKIPVLKFWELQKIFEGKADPVYPKGGDLTRKHEEVLCQYAVENYGSDFVFVTGFPFEFRPAYSQPHSRKGYTRGFDLLFKGVEIVSGGQRVHDVKLLEKQFAEKGFDPSRFEFYLEVFRFGMPPHGGQAFGLERLTAKLLGLNNVREAAFFPRDRTRVTP